MTARWLCLCVVAAILGSSFVALAQPRDKALAEALFQQARESLESGDTEKACKQFAQSQELDPSTGTLLNLAICHEKQGKTAWAWAEFTEARTQAEREKHEKRVAFATKRIEALTPRLARFSIVLEDAPPDVVVEIDDAPIAGAALGSALPVNPGSRVVRVTAPGKAPWQTTVEAVDGLTVEVRVPPLATAGQDPVEDVEMPPTTTVSPLLWVGVGIGGAGLLVGGITGALALSRGADVLDSCTDGVCPRGSEADHAEAVTLANVSNVAFGVAGAGIVLGIVGLLLSDFGVDEEAVRLDARGLRVAF